MAGSARVCARPCSATATRGAQPVVFGRATGIRPRMPTRLDSLPRRSLRDDWRVAVAVTWGSRLLGLAGLRGLGSRTALLLPACRSVHTAWMRFALDLVWVDGTG